jgi:hypothetical protein
MHIKCTQCGYTEETNKDFFVKIIGGAMPVGGFWAWTTYLFAGTGFAMAIVVAIIGGGVAMLVFKDEIVGWVIDQKYKCASCGGLSWEATDTKNTNLSNPKSSSMESKSSHIHVNDKVKNSSGKLFLSIFDDEQLDKTEKKSDD